MTLGQVWSKASFDGLNATGHVGGRGSVLAVTAQGPGADGRFGNNDDVLAPLNVAPVSVSIDRNPGPNCHDPLDRIRGFYSFHPGGANFVFGDGSVRFINDDVSASVYQALSTITGNSPDVN